ncbi:transposable element Tc1 transposase [Trichonephila clavipes]|nr:transposable element Tc1 transposase [Trichonephila clavipes]
MKIMIGFWVASIKTLRSTALPKTKPSLIRYRYQSSPRASGLYYAPVCENCNTTKDLRDVTAAQSCVFRSSGRTRVGQLGNPGVDPEMTSAREDRRLVRMAQTDRTALSRQLAAQWSTATHVSLCASSIRRRLLQRGLRARIPLCRIPLTQNHRRLRLHWANVHRSWRADWQQVIFSDKSRFNLWYHDGRTRVRLYAGELRIPECIIERHSGRTPGVMVWGAIAYHG